MVVRVASVEDAASCHANRLSAVEKKCADLVGNAKILEKDQQPGDFFCLGLQNSQNI